MPVQCQLYKVHILQHMLVPSEEADQDHLSKYTSVKSSLQTDSENNQVNSIKTEMKIILKTKSKQTLTLFIQNKTATGRKF